MHHNGTRLNIMIVTRVLTASLAAMTLLGCSKTILVDPQPLLVNYPDSFSETGFISTNDNWWREFDDPALNALINKAFTDNYSLQSFQSRLTKARALANVADARRYPELMASASSQIEAERGNSDNNIDQHSSLFTSLNASWELDLWGRNQALSDSSFYNLLATEEQFRAFSDTLAANIARTWYQLVEQKKSIDILSKQISNTKIITEVTDHRYKTGQEGISAVWRQEQLLENLQSRQASATSNFDVLTKQLNVLIGSVPNSAIDLTTLAFPTYPGLPVAGLPAELLQRRPDVKGAWYHYQSYEMSADAAESARLPNITLSSQLQSSDMLDSIDLWRLGLGIRINAPLFNAGKLKNQQKAAEADAQSALYQYTQTVIEAIAEVEMSLLKEKQQQTTLLSLKRQTKLASNTLDAEAIRYSLGAQGYLDVLNAQERLFTLEQQSLVAERQLLLSRITTYQSLGGHSSIQPRPSYPAHDETLK